MKKVVWHNGRMINNHLKPEITYADFRGPAADPRVFLKSVARSWCAWPQRASESCRWTALRRADHKRGPGCDRR